MIKPHNKTEGLLEPTDVISNQIRYVIAGVYALLTVTAISLNTPVLITFIRDKSLRTNSNRLIFSIAVGDWLHAVLAFPFGIVSNASGNWRVMASGICKWYAFITTFLSFGIMLHHATFAIERAMVINYAVEPSSVAKNLDYAIFGLWCFAFLWSIFPLFGWSSYAPEGGGTLCAIHWQSSELPAIVYILCIYVFFFLGPIIAMVTSFVLIYQIVKKMSKNAHDMWGEAAAPTLEAVVAEGKTARMAFIMSFCFIFAWTPYAVVSLYAMIAKPEIISPLVAILPALFAKSASCYNPIIYFFLFKKFRDSLRQTVRELCARFMGQETTGAANANVELIVTSVSTDDTNENKKTTSRLRESSC